MSPLVLGSTQPNDGSGMTAIQMIGSVFNAEGVTPLCVSLETKKSAKITGTPVHEPLRVVVP